MNEQTENEFLTTDQLIQLLPFTINEYEFKEVIGKGGFSVVFKIYSQKTKSFFAAKAVNINPEYDTKGTFKNTAESEINSLKQLDHPNIIKLYDYFEFRGFLILILQYCPNGSLKQRIPKNEGLSTESLNFYLNQIISAVAFVHSNHIAHRDIKPENIFLDEFNRPVLADFGLSFEFSEPPPSPDPPAKNIKDRRLKHPFLNVSQSTPQTACNKFGGTQTYEAPEIQLYYSHDPFKADMWSLGVTIYYMATGMIPWDMTNKMTLQKSILHAEYFIPKTVDRRVAEIINLLIRIAPEDRPTALKLSSISIERYALSRSQSYNFRPFIQIRKNQFLFDSSTTDTDNSTIEEKASPGQNFGLSNTFRSALTSSHFYTNMKKKKLLTHKGLIVIPKCQF